LISGSQISNIQKVNQTRDMIGVAMRKKYSANAKYPVTKAGRNAFACVKKNVEATMIKPGRKKSS
jgi:hypothetical protein